MIWRALLLAASTVVPGATAQEVGGSQPRPVDRFEEEIQVLAKLPGPPLRKVTRDDHVLWILGYPKWVPHDLLWRSDSVEHMLAQSGEYLTPPEARVSTLNPVKVTRLLKQFRRTRRIPDRGTLENLLPEDLYLLFSETRLRYAPKQDDLERLRPSVAGKELFYSAARSGGLERGYTIHRAIEKRAREHKVKEVRTVLSERYKDSPLLDSTEDMSAGAEQSCLQARLQGLDAHLEELRQLAAAWAEGDLASLRAAHPGDPAAEVCDPWRLSLNSEELSQMESRGWEFWLENADRALTNNDSTFATLPLEDLLRADGPLSQLRDRGYEVVEPDETPPKENQG
ncbi:MAG: TraB/GumN family protein [Chloroflexi bacterium]|nr:TraB/GumN family protein [Chloroflexota bacterium]